MPPLRLPLGLLLTLLALLFPAASRAAELGVDTDLTWGISSADQDRTAAALQDSGAKWTRLDVSWYWAEPSRGSYSSTILAQTDRAVELAQRAGTKIILLVSQSPGWASGTSNPNSPPRDPGDYGRFIRFIAQRYAGRIAGYEIWNEENISQFWPAGPNAAAYTSLLKAAYPQVKAGDPGAQVVFGGLSTNDSNYVEAAYAAGAKGNFDVMATHPYTYCGESPDTVWRYPDGRIDNSSFLGYRTIHQVMLAHDDPKPIWITEFGWGSSSPRQCDGSVGIWTSGVGRTTQADYLTRAAALLATDSYVQVATWYMIRDRSWGSASDDPEEHLGLLGEDFSPKPAFQAFQDVARGTITPPPAPTTDTGSAPPSSSGPAVDPPPRVKKRKGRRARARQARKASGLSRSR